MSDHYPGDEDHAIHHDSAGHHPHESHWYAPEHDHGSGISSQHFVLGEHTAAHHHTEAELIGIATDHGWYVPGGGTPLYDLGSLLEHFGMPVDRKSVV